MKRSSVVIILILIAFFLLLPKQVKAATGKLISVSDTVNTSRPSAASPLNANATSTDNTVVVIDNGGYFLASDSAIFKADTGETENVVQVTAATIGSGVRTLYLKNAIGNNHHRGDAVVANVTSTHKIQFNVGEHGLPNNGKIVLTFPGAGTNLASPSATGFSFNGMPANAASEVLCYPTAACAGGVAASGGNTITLTSNATYSPGQNIVILVGCTAQSNGTCTTYAPRLINPTVSSSTVCAGSPETCTADTWTLGLKTQDSSLVDLDTGTAKIATVNAVTVQATVEPYITFTIAGVANGTTINTHNTSCGSNNDVTNAGTDAGANTVNLGTLGSGVINKAAQDLTVSTNGTGYVITATSSGRFIDKTSGLFLTDNMTSAGLTGADTPVPAVFPATGNPYFGIHACGPRTAAVGADIWANNSATSFSSGAKYSNPFNTGTNGYSATLATYSGGPISADVTTVEYAASISNTTYAGIYRNTLTYVATATF